MIKERLDNMTMAHITTFLSVSRTLNMSLSARELYLGQPTVSKRIAEVEAIVGFRLFDRSGNRLALTEAGRYLYLQLSEQFERLEKTMYDAAAIDRGYSEHLNICVDTIFGVKNLYKVFHEFRKLYPRVMVNVETDVYNVKKRIVDGEIDLAFTDYEPNGEYEYYLEYHFVKDYQLCAVLHRDHPLAAKDSLSVLDLQDVPLTIPKEDTIGQYRRTLENLFSQYHIQPVIGRQIESSRLELQALFNKEVVIMVADTMKENLPETVEMLNKYTRVFPLDYVMRSGICWKYKRKTPIITEFLRIFEENSVRRQKTNKDPS